MLQRTGPSADCTRALDANVTLHLPTASYMRAYCSPWVYEPGTPAWNSSLSPRCASIDHLRAGYGSYLHHALHGVFLARERGRRLVPLLHHWVRREVAERAQMKQQANLLIQGNTVNHTCWWRSRATSNGSAPKCMSPCQVRLLSCTTGLVEPPCDSAPRWVRLSTIGVAHRRHSLFEVGQAALEMLRPLLPAIAPREVGAVSDAATGCIAVQLRYGDSCGKNAFHTARRCTPVGDYMRGVQELHSRYGYRRIVVTSDSARALHEFVRLLPPGLHAARPPTASHQLLGDSLNDTDKMVEEIMRRNRSAAYTMFETFVADLAALSTCDAVVAKFTSNMARLAYELISARLGRTAPFVSLDAPWCFGGRQWSPEGRGFFAC